MVDQDEAVAGTDVTDAASFFAIGDLDAAQPGAISVHTITGRLYAVERNDNLAGVPQVWTEFTNNIPGTGGPLVITDPLPGTNRNYRVRVQLAS